PLLPYEIRGEKGLEIYARALLGEEPPELTLPQVAGAILLERSDWQGLEQAELILFGGKGGVGKTTSAAATALHLSSLSRGGKTLIFSTDPAHSLGDSFNREIGDRVTPIAGVEGLFALEIDPAHLLDELKREYRESIDEAFSAFLGSGVDVPYDRAIMEKLINSTPPGIDELMGLMKIMDFMEAQEFDRYILDMAPTGHALRFLELPDIIREWFKTAFRLLLKYRKVGGSGLNKAAELIVKRWHQLKLVEGVLRDPQRCQFVGVTIPEAMSLVETKRLVQRLTELRIACREVIVNMVVPATECGFCSAKRHEQQGHLEEFKALGLGLTQVPLFPHQIVGLEALQEMARAIYGGQEEGRGKLIEPAGLARQAPGLGSKR
ncbi:MAG: ArsA family ATPase, partial [Dehalococcoidia bacterium]